jgi:RNA polymerase sigma-70 factor (ECF subfamily)
MKATIMTVLDFNGIKQVNSQHGCCQSAASPGAGPFDTDSSFRTSRCSIYRNSLSPFSRPALSYIIQAMNDTRELVARAVEEKREGFLTKPAFGELVRRYQDMVFGFVYAIVRDHFLAQDVTQEAFIIAYNKLETLIQGEAFPSWLRRIAGRESSRALRKRGGVCLPPEVMESRASDYRPPEALYEKKEAQDEIRAAVGRLPEGQRIPVILYYIDGYSQSDIADFLELKVNTVKKRIQRGRDNVQKDIMGMVKNDLRNIRPSRDGRLVNTINLYTTFDSAAKTGQLDLLEQMLVDGVGVNSEDSKGRTLLHWAVEANHVEAVRILLKYGADRNKTDSSRKTPYQLAREAGNTAILRLFDSVKGGSP